MNLFSRQNLKKKDKQNDNIYRLLLPSFIAICICMICLSTATWAWFTSATSTSVSSIKAAYNLSYGINNYDKLTLIDGSVTYTIDNTGTCSITLSAENSTTNGYCIINYGGKDYYTSSISKGTTYGFTITASEGTVITLTPKWGSLPSGIVQDNIISNVANNGSNNAIVISALDGESADDELTTNEEDVDTDVDNKKEEEDASENKELTNEEKDNFSSGSEEENQNIEETEKQNEEPSKDSSESSPTEVTNSDDKTIKDESDESHNSSSELTESVNSGNDSAES
jgi:hypothetical protein